MELNRFQKALRAAGIDAFSIAEMVNAKGEKCLAMLTHTEGRPDKDGWLPVGTCFTGQREMSAFIREWAPVSGGRQENPTYDPHVEERLSEL